MNVLFKKKKIKKSSNTFQASSLKHSTSAEEVGYRLLQGSRIWALLPGRERGWRGRLEKEKWDDLTFRAKEIMQLDQNIKFKD